MWSSQKPRAGECAISTVLYSEYKRDTDDDVCIICIGRIPLIIDLLQKFSLFLERGSHVVMSYVVVYVCIDSIVRQDCTVYDM